MNKKNFAVILLLSLTFALTACSGEDSWICVNGEWIEHGHPDASKPTEGCTAEPVVTEPVVTDMLKIANPTPNSEVSSPLKITGDAKGPWYFEGSFPVKLLDANDKVLAQGIAKANGEWMTENFVPFEASLSFSKPATNTGTLVLSKDNPSGLPENDKSVNIPVKFSTAEETMTVKVFFSNDKLDPGMMNCEKTYPIERTIPKTKAVARAAIETMLKGISMEEADNGYYDHINAGVKIQSLEIKEGIAYIDFNQALQDKVGGSCKTAAIRSQIAETLKQFPSIKDVVISINGDSETILQP